MDGERKSPNATLEQAAQFLKVSPRSVQNYERQGLLTTVYLGRRRFFKWSELSKLAKNGVPRHGERPLEHGQDAQ
jgi:hypothetical protein